MGEDGRTVWLRTIVVVSEVRRNKRYVLGFMQRTMNVERHAWNTGAANTVNDDTHELKSERIRGACVN